MSWLHYTLEQIIGRIVQHNETKEFEDREGFPYAARKLMGKIYSFCYIKTKQQACQKIILNKTVKDNKNGDYLPVLITFL